MFYYEVFYETIPSSIPADLIEEGETDIEQIYYFEHATKLDSPGVRRALEWYLGERKIKYDQLQITQINEISKEEYYSHTRYE